MSEFYELRQMANEQRERIAALNADLAAKHERIKQLEVREEILIALIEKGLTPYQEMAIAHLVTVTYVQVPKVQV